MPVTEEKADSPMIVRAMDQGKFVRINDSFKAIVGFGAAELAEKPFLDWIDPRDRTIVQAALENDERLFFARHTTRDGNSVQLRLQLAKHEDGLYVLGRCAKLTTVESDAARSAQATVSGTLDAIARIIEEQNPGYKCSILLVADGRFVFGAGPSLPKDYNAAVDGYAVGPTVGSCGTAIFWNTPVIVEDIQADPLWSALAALAKKAGVAACWSHPFVGSSGNVLGALALYSPEPRTPTAEQLSLLKAFARITGLAVERGRAEEELKRADEAIKAVRIELQATLNALPDLLFEVDAEGRIFRYHTHRDDLLAAPPEAFMGKRFFDVLPPDAADACQRAIDEAAQKGFSYGEVYRLALPQGEHWFELAVAPMYVDDTANPRFVIISRDITERKQIAFEQQQREQYQRALLDNFPFAVWLKNTESRFLAVNQGFVQLFGQRNADELIGKNDFDIAPADLAENYRTDDQAVLASGNKKSVEEEIIDADGTRKWFETYKAPVFDGTGSVVGTVGFARDITEYRAAAQSLHEMSAALATSRDLLQQVIDTVPIRVFWKDREGRYLGCNPAFAHDAGKNTPSELIGQDDSAMSWAAQAELYRADDQAVMQTGQARLNFEEPQTTPDGKTIWLRTSKVPLYDRQSEVVGVLGVYDDITEHKREERRHALALDASKILVWEIDFTTGKLDYDSSGRHSLGLNEPSAPDTLERWLAQVHPDDRPGFEALVEQVLQPGEEHVFDCEYRLLPPGGDDLWVQTVGRVAHRDKAGRPLLGAGYTVNINVRKRTEQALKASEEAQRTLIAALPDVIMRFDPEGRHIFVSENVSEVTGLPATAFIGKTHHELGFPEPMCAIWDSAIQQPFLTGQPHEIEFELDGPSGHVVFNWRLTPDADAEGRVHTVLAVASEITERKRAEAALRESETRHRVLFESAGDAIMTLAPPSWRFARGNSTVISMFGARDEVDFISRAPWQYSPDKQPDGSPSSDKAREMIETALREGSHLFEWVHKRQNGEIFPATVLLSRFELGDQTLLQANVRDITQRKKAEEAMRLAANVFTHAREGITIADRYANILDVNAAFTEITGYSREEVLGKNPRILNSGKQDKAFYAAMWHDLQSKGYWYGEIWNRRKDGQVVAEMLTISAVRDERGDIQNYIALFSDITAIKQHQAQLEYIAHYDALTGLPNRLLLGDRLRQAMSQAPRRGQRLAVAYLDLDGFKAVNDTHGHEVGDQLLATLARRMTQVLRDGDTLGRLGGDEFVAVLVDLSDIEASVPILTRLLEAAAQPFPVGDLVLNISASLGVAFFPQGEAVDADQLLRQADQAMYQAKQAGKNRYHAFDAEHDRHVRGRHENLEHIRQALAERQFSLYYQPKVNMCTGEVVGAEALIRWQHPLRGLLLPAVFLPVVEDKPLAIDLGEWVIDAALTQIEAWHVDGVSTPVSVNVGALQLQHPDFVSRLRTLLSRHPGVNPGELELEILETSALEDFAGVTQVMTACQELGVGFALDDFGTGYSSLTYLKQLPVSLLKVDQSFVRDMLEDPDDLAILDGVLGLATAFRSQVIAEGVETLAHGEMLLRLGCEWAQGYAIARPMPAHDFQRWVRTWDAPPAWKALKPISRDRLPALFAAVEHRAWICVMGNFLSGKSDTPPQRDAHQCRFGHWLDHGGQNLLWGEGANHPVVALHRDIHRLAAELMALKCDGRADEVQTGISELHRLRDQLLEQLSELY